MKVYELYYAKKQKPYHENDCYFFYWVVNFELDFYVKLFIYPIMETFYGLFMSLNEFFDPKNGKFNICFIFL